MGRDTSGSWAKYGCLTVAGVLAIVLFALAVAIGAAVRQNRSATFDQQALVPDIPAPGQTTGTPEPVRLRLEAHTAGVSVRPVPAG